MPPQALYYLPEAFMWAASAGLLGTGLANWASKQSGSVSMPSVRRSGTTATRRPVSKNVNTDSRTGKPVAVSDATVVKTREPVEPKTYPKLGDYLYNNYTPGTPTHYQSVGFTPSGYEIAPIGATPSLTGQILESRRRKGKTAKPAVSASLDQDDQPMGVDPRAIPNGRQVPIKEIDEDGNVTIIGYAPLPPEEDPDKDPDKDPNKKKKGRPGRAWNALRGKDGATNETTPNPNNNQNGSFIGRMLWETKNNNFGQNYWQWRNVGRVGLSLSYPAREYVWPAVGQGIKYMAVGPDSIPPKAANDTTPSKSNSTENSVNNTQFVQPVAPTDTLTNIFD